MKNAVREYLPKETCKNLEALNNERCAGFLLIVDIKESTKRKKDKPLKWVQHTNAINESFRELCKEIHEKNKKVLDEATLKYLGDSVVGFFKQKNANKPEDTANALVSMNILDSLRSYLNYIEEKSALLENIRLKSVLTYLTGIKVNDGNTDFLGRGVDFSFRLEKFADSSHIVINEMYFTGLKKDSKKKLVEGSNLCYIKCTKKVKGWDAPQDFYLLTNREMIENAVTTFVPSEYSDDVKTELINYLISDNEEATVEPNEEMSAIMEKGVGNES